MDRPGATAHDVHLHYFLRPDHWEVADLWVSNWGADMPALGFRARHDWLFQHLETLHEQGATTICAVNTRTGGIAGFVTLDTHAGRLDQIVVASSARGSGVAGALMGEAKRISHGALRAQAPAGDARALRFFEREGFVRAAGEDAPPGFVSLRFAGA
ncbi:MAG: GCN5-related N-acetyltransferase [Hyphomicrobiales bacterium]|nr:GCN5-related N-acetyltransferase [Hyphomicrobiales bacterium]